MTGPRGPAGTPQAKGEGAPGHPPGGPAPAAARLDVESDIEPQWRPQEGFRARTARGVLVLSSFRIALAGLNLARVVVLAAFLTPEDYGLWGLIVTTLVTLAFLKQVGIADKFVQQRERNQEQAFQRAFTLELAYSGLFFLIVAIAVPVYALGVYDRTEVLLPAAVLSLTLLFSAFQSPVWIFYRRMQYGRQLSLEAIDPVLTTVSTITLLVLGMGIWGLVVGSMIGTVVSSVAATVVCPYRIRLDFDWDTFRQYVGFSWPLLISGLSGLLVVQGALIVGNAALGLAAVGAIGLAASFARFSVRVEMLIRRSLYPAICAVQERREVLLETFEKSNRLGLMWAIPFGAGLALFGGDLVAFVLGERWSEAVPLLRYFGVIFATGTIGFAWATFYKAQGETRPMAVTAVLNVVVFFAATVPLMLTVGVMGYAYGMLAAALIQLGMRGFFLRRLFPDLNFPRHILRAVLPSIPAIAGTLLLRQALDGGPRSGADALVEIALYVLLTVAVTVAFERTLLREALGYLRRAARPKAVRSPEPGAEPA